MIPRRAPRRRRADRRTAPAALRALLPVALSLCVALAACSRDPAPGPGPAPAPVAVPGVPSAAVPALPPPPVVATDEPWDPSLLLAGADEDLPAPGSGRARLTGRVVDPAGRPVMGAVVELCAVPPIGSPHLLPVVHATGTTGPDGTFDLAGGPEPWVDFGLLSVRAPGYARTNLRDRDAAYEEAPFHATPGIPADVRLRRGVPVTGRVLTNEGKVPVEPVVVTAGGPYFFDSARSGPDGAFTMTVPVGETQFATLPGAYAQVTGVLRLDEESPPPSFEMTVRKPVDVAGRVVDAETGAPVAGAVIRGFYGETRILRSGDDGRFTLPAYWFSAAMVRAPGYAERIHQLAEDAGERLQEVRLAPGFVVSGRVKDLEGRPVAAARVWCLTADRAGSWVDVRGPLTDAEGNFRFVGLPVPAPGREIRIFCRRRGFAHAHSEPLLARPRADLRGIEMTMRRLVDVEGVVKDEAGVPLGARLLAHWDLGPGMLFYGARIPTGAAIRVRDDGRWHASLPERTEVRLEVRSDLYGEVQQTIRTPAHDAPREPVVFRVVRGSSIRGRLVDSAGKPVGRGEIRVEPDPPTDKRPSRDASAKPDGTFVAGGLVPGKYDFSVLVYPEFLQEVVRGVAADGPEIVVRLRRPGGLAGRIRLPDGTVPKGVPLRLSIRGLAETRPLPADLDREFHDADGRFLLAPLAPGPYALSLQAGEFRLDRELRIEEGAPTDLGDVVLSPGAVASGRVVCAGEPVRGGVVEVLQVLEGGRSRSVARCEVERDGTWRTVALAPGSYRATVRPQDRPAAEAAFAVEGATSVEVLLDVPPGGGAVVSVTDAAGSPVAGATVAFTGPAGSVPFWDRGSAQAPPHFTGKDGVLRAAGLPPGRYRVTAEPPGKAAGEAEVTVVEGEDAEVAVRLP